MMHLQVSRKGFGCLPCNPKGVSTLASSTRGRPVKALRLETTPTVGETPSTARTLLSQLPAVPAPKRAGSLPLLDIQPELWAIGSAYFVQGVLELATLAQTYMLKDELGASPAQVSIFLSVAGIPWTIKPLIGFVSDTIPLFGFKRRSYLMLASVAGTAAFLMMGLGAHSLSGFVFAMFLSSSACAVSDVVADSIVVERARGETPATAGSLQSLCWASYALAQIITASVSGGLVQAYGPRFVFNLTAACPLLVGLASLMLQEERASNAWIGMDSPPAAVTSSSSTMESSLTAGTSSSSHSSSSSEAVPSSSKQVSSSSSSSSSTEPAPVVGVGSDMVAHAQTLMKAMSRAEVLAPLAFLVLLSATPSADSAMFYYMTEELEFSAAFLGQVQLAAAFASFAGVILYNSALKAVPVRQLMLWGTLLATAMQSSQLVLVSGLHRSFGLDDHMFVLGGSIVMDTIQNVLSMPTMVLAARLCPPGVEATAFALIMSLTNLADGVRMGGGAALMSWLGINGEDFTNMPTLLAICNASLLLPLFLLPLIPAEYDQASGVEAIAPGTSETGSDGATASSSHSGMVMDELALSEAGRTVSIPGAEQHAHHHFATHFSDTSLSEALATDHAAAPASATGSVLQAPVFESVSGTVAAIPGAGTFSTKKFIGSDGEPAVVYPVPASASQGATTLELRVAARYRQQREQRFLQRQRKRQYARAVRSLSAGPSDSADNSGRSSGSDSSGNEVDHVVEAAVVVLPAAPLTAPLVQAEGSEPPTAGTQQANNIVPSWITPPVPSTTK